MAGGNLKQVRNPGSIANLEHHDASRASRGMAGIPLKIEKIIQPTTIQPVQDRAVLRVTNTGAATHYIWSGLAEDEPVTVDITTGIALTAGMGLTMFVGESESLQSQVVKTSSSDVQVVVFKNK